MKKKTAQLWNPESDLNLRVIEKITADDQARRELIWIRAKEKGVEGDAPDLEQIDPWLIERVDLIEEIQTECSDITRWEVKEAYAQLWQDCFDRHAQRLTGG